MRRAVEIEPALAASEGRYAGALFFPQDESGDAHKFTAALAAAAERQGVTFRYGVSLPRLQANGERIEAVDTDQGRFEADAFVMSLGSFSPLLLRKIGIRVPIYPLKGYSITIPTDGHDGAPCVAIHEGSRRIVMSRLGERLDGIDHVPPEATYLAWLDCRKRDLGPSPAEFLRREARVWLSDGAHFGEPGEGFVRLNFATSRPILDEILERIAKALDTAS